MCLRTLYYPFLYPYLSYCIEVWGSATTNRLNCLVVVQKRAIRLITRSGYRDHTQPLFDKLKLLNLNNIYQLRVGLLMLKFYQGKLPAVFDNMFVYSNTRHDHATRQQHSLYVPLAKTRFRRQSVSVKGVSIWNNVIKVLDIHCSMHTFKSKLSNLLLSDHKFM